MSRSFAETIPGIVDQYYREGTNILDSHHLHNSREAAIQQHITSFVAWQRKTEHNSGFRELVVHSKQRRDRLLQSEL